MSSAAKAPQVCDQRGMLPVVSVHCCPSWRYHERILKRVVSQNETVAAAAAAELVLQASQRHHDSLYLFT